MQLWIGQRLQIQGENIPLVIEWTDQTRKTIKDSITTQITIRGPRPEHTAIQIIVRTMEMELPCQSITKELLTAAGIQNNNIAHYNNAQPQILIGLDNTHAVATIEAERHKNLLVCNTPLGWTVEGMIGGEHESTRQAIQFQTMNLVELNHIVRQFIENENMGIDPKRQVLESKEIRSAKAQLENGIRKIEKGYGANYYGKAKQDQGLVTGITRRDD